MKSVWSASAEFEKRPSLEGDASAETAVIGGGLAGVLTAFLLQERGIETAVIEAERIGSGQTKNTTAKITAQHGLIYGRLIRDFGLLRAKRYAQANMLAISEYRRIVSERKIECDFSDCPAYLYSVKNSETLELELEATRLAGIEAALTDETELPFSVGAALRFDGQAVFNPLKFLKAVSDGLTVYENTRAIKVEKEAVITDRGTVRAKHIVFATHFPFINVPGYYFMKMHQSRSYVLALEDAARLKGAYLGVDDGALSFRSYGGVTLLGGGGHRTGENSQGGKYDELRARAREFWPDSREISRWSAQDCMTPDGIPYIGRYSRSRPGWYVCTGFNKWGMTGCMTAARIISAQIAGERLPYAAVFSPGRSTVPPAAKQILKDGIQAVRGVGREIFGLPEGLAENLPEGRGGIVEYRGVKYGVYKDEEGACHIVDIRCPHLGCMLEWNPDEKSWDCPCHGSRFDIFGRLVDNPAQENLESWIRTPGDLNEEQRRP